MVITISTDSNYIGYTSTLLKSIRHNCPHTKVHLRAIDCSSEDIQILKSSHDSVIIDIENLNLSVKRRYTRAGSVLSTNILKKGPNPTYLLSERQCYVSNTRYRNILHCMEVLNEDIVILLDADAIVKKDLTELVDIIKKYDVMCNVGKLVDRYPNGRCWECSCIIATNNEKSVNFFNEVKRKTEENMLDWDSDQFAIENTYSENIYTINLCEDIGNIEDLSWRILTVDNWDVLDFMYDEDTYIWPGSGEAKYTKAYKNEQSRYN